MSESTGSRSRLIMSEMFVLCSGLLVSLTFESCHQRSHLSEIRWLNVKQPTSTRLWLERDRSRSRSNSARLDSIQHSRSGLIDVVDSGSSSNGLWLDPARTGSGSTTIRITCTRCVVSCGSSQRALVSVTYRSDPRDQSSRRSVSGLSDRNCENFRLKHSTRSLRAQSSSVRRIRLHTLNHDV